MKNKPTSYYPVFLDLHNKKVTIVGGGSVAERKVMALLDTGAHITVISPELTEPLKKLRDDGLIVHHEKRYEGQGELKEAFVVIAATSDEEVNARVAHDAEGLLNVVDTPEFCNFIVPSVVKRSPLSIAISTGGVSPAFSRTIRKELEQLFGQDVAEYLICVKEIRKRAKKEIGDTKKREAFLREIASPEMLHMVRAEGSEAACSRAEELLGEYVSDSI